MIPLRNFEDLNQDEIIKDFEQSEVIRFLKRNRRKHPL